MLILPSEPQEMILNTVKGSKGQVMKPATILIIEDNPLTTEMVRITLESQGYVVVTAPDARAGIAMMVEKAPNLILQDLLLPDMDGLDLISRLRGLPEGRVIPILAFSAFNGRLEAARQANGFSGCIPKPIEPLDLLAVVHSYLNPEPQVSSSDDLPC